MTVGRIAGLLLAALLCLAAPTAGAEDGKPLDRAAVEKIVREYILAHPEVVIEALQGAEEKEKQAGAARADGALKARKADIFDDPTSPVLGNPKGDVTLVAFLDYRCPYCKQVAPALEQLTRDDGKLRIVVKEWPILGKDSVFAARLALAARKQGRYEAVHQQLLGSKGQLGQETALKIAANAGVDVAKAKADMDGSDIDDVIKRSYDLADSLDLHGTPAFIIGSEVIPGAVDVATLKRKIAALRAGG